METFIAQDSLIDQFKSDVQSIFPELPITEWGYGYDFHVSLGSSNHNFRKSKYFFDSAGQTFFHLTSYKNFFSIVNSGAFRLYNLSNSNDANELESYRDVGFSEESIKLQKEDIFILSCCQEADINNTTLWDNYGKVAIVFEMVNESNSWKYFHFSKVNYEKDPAFSKYFELRRAYQAQYPHLQFSHESLRDLIAFHKVPSLNWEQEVRLMYLPSRYHQHYDQFPDFKTSEHHTGFTKYVELALSVEPYQRDAWLQEDMRIKQNLPQWYYDERPRIRIKSVRFGDNELLMNQEKFDKLYYELKDLLLQRFGYPIEVNRELFKTGIS